MSVNRTDKGKWHSNEDEDWLRITFESDCQQSIHRKYCHEVKPGYFFNKAFLTISLSHRTGLDSWIFFSPLREEVIFQVFHDFIRNIFFQIGTHSGGTTSIPTLYAFDSGCEF